MSNQVDQMYVITGLADGMPEVGDGTIAVKNAPNKKSKYFVYGGPTTLLRSDLIQNIVEMRVLDAKAMTHKLYTTTVTLDETVNEGNPIIGQDYELKIQIKQYQDLAEDSIYCKYGFVHVTSLTSTPGAFYIAMGKSLAKNFSRELVQLFKFGVATDDATVYFNATTGELEEEVAAEDVTGIVIEELAQRHVVGHMPLENINFDVICDKVICDGEEYTWGVVAEPEVYDTLPNGHALADMEYFMMGERGDQYRDFAPVQHRLYGTFAKPQIDCEKEYDVVTIHYFFVDSLGGAQKSEKDIHFVIEHNGGVGTNGVLKNIAKAILGDFSKAIVINAYGESSGFNEDS